MDIKLNFINQSDDTNNSAIVIFSQDANAAPGQSVVAWLVIQNCAVGDNHPFTYPENNTVGASDSFGNFTPQLPAPAGQAFQMIRNTSGDVLVSAGNAANPQDIEVSNKLPGAI